MEQNTKTYNEKDTKITFVIPSIGRINVVNAIASLINQTNPNWKAIIVFDGVEKNITINDPRIRCVEIPKTGEGHNSAGNVRNEGMKWVTTEWIGFLDDDDIVSSRYVETFLKEIQEHSFIDVIIFRMYQEIEKGKKLNRVLPELDTQCLSPLHVGISFAFRTKIFKSGVKFIPSDTEDYVYLHSIISNDFNVMLSPFVRYFARNVNDGCAYIDYDKFTNDEIYGSRLFFQKP